MLVAGNRSRAGLFVGIAALVLSALTVRLARAQAGGSVSQSEPTPNASAPENADEARANELFYEGRRLLESQRYVEACARFRQSLALKRSPGRLLNVGDCLVRENDLVAALETFEDAQALALREPDPAKRDGWLAGAQREIEVLRGRVAEVTLTVAPTPGLQLQLDGRPIEPNNQRRRLAPGHYVLAATAPGCTPYQYELTATPGGKLGITVPRLEPALHTSSVAMTAAGAHDIRSSVLPWTLIGTGAAVLGAGIVTGLITAKKAGELQDNCPNDKCPTPAQEPGWQGKIDSANRLALLTTLLWGTGLASAGLGVTLLVTDDSPSAPASARVQGGWFDGSWGMRVQGQF